MTLRQAGLALLLGSTGSCGPHSYMESSVRPTPSGTTCPYVPAGHDSWLSIVAVSPAGDTIPNARVHLTGTLWRPAGERPATPTDSTSPTGIFAIGPLEVGEYHLTVEAPHRRSATQKLKFCGDATVTLRAVLQAAPAT